MPINLLDLPRNLTGFERLDDFNLDVPATLTQVGSQSFNLVSFVSAKVNKVGPQVTRGFIIGNMAWVKTNRPGDEAWVCYDPRRVTKGQVVQDQSLMVKDKQSSFKPTERIARARPIFRFEESEAMDNARHYGTVFVYSSGVVNDVLRQLPRNQVVFTSSQ